MNGFEIPLLSPCINHCCLDDNDICMGCFRSLDEIRLWHSASNAERQTILQAAQQRQKAQPNPDNNPAK